MKTKCQEKKKNKKKKNKKSKKQESKKFICGKCGEYSNNKKRLCKPKVNK